MKTAIRLAAATAALAALAACEPTGSSGTGSEGGVPYGTYVVVGFGKEAVPTRDGYVRLGPGTIEGRGPCNTFSAVNGRTLPDIYITTMNWTDNPCGHRGFEGQLFEALTQAQRAVWEGGVLKIIGPTYITLERTGG